jgi:hypothetical protein
MLIIDDDLLHRLKRPKNDLLNLEERVVDLILSVLRDEVKLETSQVPFSTHPGVIVLRGFLDSDVGEMNKVIGNVINVCGVSIMSEPCEPFSAEVNGQGIVAGHEDVNSQVELFTANLKRAENVPGDDIGVGLRGIWFLPFEVCFPL